MVIQSTKTRCVIRRKWWAGVASPSSFYKEGLTESFQDSWINMEWERGARHAIPCNVLQLVCKWDALPARWLNTIPVYTTMDFNQKILCLANIHPHRYDWSLYVGRVGFSDAQIHPNQTPLVRSKTKFTCESHRKESGSSSSACRAQTKSKTTVHRFWCELSVQNTSFIFRKLRQW